MSAGYGDIRAQVGARSVLRPLPHRLVFGRRHRVDGRSLDETFLPIGDLPSMSARWFRVEDVTVAPRTGGPAGTALRVLVESEQHGVQVWDGAEPVRLRPGGSYLAQGTTLFVGDLLGERIWGARLDLTPAVPGTLPPTGDRAGDRTGDPAGGTLPPGALELPDGALDVLLARYHRYYRHPPWFDPQPVPWADVAVVLGLLDLRESGDRHAVRRAVKDPQETVTRVKQRIDALHPGWLPPSSETQKTFHDHLRIVLELHGHLEPHVLRGFDRRHPRALAMAGGPPVTGGAGS